MQRIELFMVETSASLFELRQQRRERRTEPTVVISASEDSLSLEDFVSKIEQELHPERIAVLAQKYFPDLLVLR